MRFRPLKDYVQKAGGLRLSMHPRLREQLVDMAVEEFPADANFDTAAEVLAARLTIRARRQYGKLLVFVFVASYAAIVAKLVCQWHDKRNAHRVLMLGWQDAARKGR